MLIGKKGQERGYLFDLLLKEEGSLLRDIVGYEREMFSHLSVAAEVKSDEQAVGLGIYTAAKTMGLDFVPCADESYDLLMTKEFFESEQGKQLIKVIQSEDFKQNVDEIGGYKVVDHPEPIFLIE